MSYGLAPLPTENCLIRPYVAPSSTSMLSAPNRLTTYTRPSYQRTRASECTLATSHAGTFVVTSIALNEPVAKSDSTTYARAARAAVGHKAIESNDAHEKNSATAMRWRVVKASSGWALRGRA